MEPIAEETPRKLIPTPPSAESKALTGDSRPLTMPQKQFSLLAQAFKGSANHAPSPHGRKPSMMKLSKRVDSEESVQTNSESEKSFHSERSLKPGSWVPRKHFQERLHFPDLDIDTSDNHAAFETPEVIKLDAEGTEPAELSEAQIQERRLQDLLKSIAFHTHTDQSISAIDVKVHAEKQWLSNNPSTATWSEISERVQHNRQEEQMLEVAHQNDIANRFLDAAMLTGAVHVNNLLNGADNEKERLVVRLVFSLLNDTVEEIMAEVAAEISQLATQASTILNKSLVKSLASVSLGTEGSNSRFWKMSGREQVLKGALLDALRVPPRPPQSHSETPASGIASNVSATSIVKLCNNSNAQSGSSTLNTTEDRNMKNSIRTTQPSLLIPTSAVPNPVPAQSAPPLPVPPPVCDKIVHIPSMLPSTTESIEDIESGYDSDDSETEEEINNNPTNNNASNGATPSTSSKQYLQELYHIEVAHWKGINFISVVNSPVQIPSNVATPNKYMSVFTNSSVKGVVTCMRIFPLTHVLYTSLLVCGLCNGRVIVYTIRYTGEPAEILCTSALPNKADQAPIVDIKCGSSGVSSLLCMNSTGLVSVLHVNTALCANTPTALQPVPRKKWSLFRYKTAPKSNTMTNMHSVNSNDLIFTLPTLQDTINMSVTDTHDLNNLPLDSLTTGTTNHGTTKQSNNNALNILPTSICFHHSVTLFGNNVSFMVGASNGDVVKFNYDYMHNTIASTIINTPPFVYKEFIHPNNAVKGFVLTNGVNEKLGNKVYRELFHYHKSKIILLDVVNAISPYLISVDQSGRVALWHYDAKYFEGKCWFRPFCTSKLSLDMVDLLPTGDTVSSNGFNTTISTVVDNAVTEAPDANAEGKDYSSGTVKTDKLTLSEETISKLVVREVYPDNNDIHTMDGATDRVCFIYEPVYNEALGAYVQYSAIEYTTVVESLPMDVNPVQTYATTDDNNQHTVGGSGGSQSRTDMNTVETEGAASEVVNVNGGGGAIANEGKTAYDEGAIENIESTDAIKNNAEDVNIACKDGPSDVPTIIEPSIAAEPSDAANHTHEMGGDGVRVSTVPSDSNGHNDSDLAAVDAPADEAIDATTELAPTPQPLPLPLPVTYASSEANITHPEPVLTEEKEEQENKDENGQEESGVEETMPADRTESRTDEAVPPNPVYDTSTITQEAGNANEDTSPIPKTIFTALTALIEQYRQKRLADPDTPEEKMVDEDTSQHNAAVVNISEPEKRAITPADHVTDRTAALLPLPSTHTINTQPPVSIIPATPAASTIKRVREFISATVLAEQTLSFTIMSCKMSYDGAEVVMLLASRVNSSNNTDHIEGDEDVNHNTTAIHTVYYIIPYFPLTQKFHRFYPRLYLNNTDCVVDYCVGPLQFETLTRTVFVLTKTCVRLFSLHTGREIITSCSHIFKSSPSSSTDNNNTTNNNDATYTPLPFTWSLPSFAPTTIALCPSQRVLTLSAHDDTRVVVYLLQHTNDGGATLHTTESAELLNRFKLYEKVRPAEKTVLPAAEGTGIHTVLNIVTYIPPELQYVTDEANDIVDLIFDHVWRCVEMNKDQTRRKGLITQLYGTKSGINEGSSNVNLGFIEPTVWPPLQEYPVLKISIDEVEIPSVSPKAKSPRGKKHKKKKEKKSAEATNEAIAAESDDVNSVLL